MALFKYDPLSEILNGPSYFASAPLEVANNGVMQLHLYYDGSNFFRVVKITLEEVSNDIFIGYFYHIF